jgi:hypothetical protein
MQRISCILPPNRVFQTSVFSVAFPSGLWTKSFCDGADRLIARNQTNGVGCSSAPGVENGLVWTLIS